MRMQYGHLNKEARKEKKRSTMTKSAESDIETSDFNPDPPPSNSENVDKMTLIQTDLRSDYNNHNNNYYV